jgi:hypothetical protein
MTNRYVEPTRNIPVLGHFDVIVCGGGAAGCAAAIESARLGADTLLIEKDGFLGGATVSQLVGHILSTNGVDFQGIWHEWFRAVQNRGGACKLIGNPPLLRSGVDPEVVKFAWDDLLTVAGVRQLLHAWCSDAIVDNGVCGGVVIETKAGRQAVYAKRVIDCTADGIVCAAAGVPWQQGSINSKWGQALTKVFRMGNVKWPENGFTADNIDTARKLIEEATARGEYDSPVIVNGRVVTYGMGNSVHNSVAPYRTEMNVFSSRVLKVNPLDPWDITRAEREGRQQAWQCADALKKYAPGYENAYLLDTNIHIGLRDSRRITGCTTATADDVLQFNKYADGIARSSWDIDIWPADSYTAPAVDRESPEYQVRKEKIINGDYFDIRLGSIIATGIDNLLVAGRCLSAEQQAQASLRIQQTCQSTGQAAGAVAALSLQNNITPREINPAIVVNHLAISRDVEPAF